jgi:hypothetical protein
MIANFLCGMIANFHCGMIADFLYSGILANPTLLWDRAACKAV